MIHYTLDILGAFIGPLFGILISDFYIVKQQRIVVDELYTMSETGRYWYDGGYNRKAVMAIIPSALVPALCAFIPALSMFANFTWFIGVALGFGIYTTLMRRQSSLAPQPT